MKNESGKAAKNHIKNADLKVLFYGFLRIISMKIVQNRDVVRFIKKESCCIMCLSKKSLKYFLENMFLHVL